MLRFLCSAVLLFPLLVSSVGAQVPPEWRERYDAIVDRGVKSCKDNKVFENLRREAQEGDPLAAYWVYNSMSRKTCVRYSSNPFNRTSYLEQAAKAEYPDAVRLYGKNMLYGYGLKKNPNKGIGYLKKAYELGSPYGASELAYAYGKGNVVRRNPKLALEYLEKAIKAGIDRKQMTVIASAMPYDLSLKAWAVIDNTKPDPNWHAAVVAVKPAAQSAEAAVKPVALSSFSFKPLSAYDTGKSPGRSQKRQSRFTKWLEGR
ncbi:tetratricopeptide repeat protein [Roseibium aggregatum]|uniref:Sel1 repeat family protein n=1 Tax=Roseibium aggregatum TaxID=187304 RepID=A0A939EIZ7_9HYPH|nr:SEL1-like repeat protein [Roseibium aggregatum]MBN9674015.1 sel1 repeat family protein [Roseibium aggregatum]